MKLFAWEAWWNEQPGAGPQTRHGVDMETMVPQFITVEDVLSRDTREIVGHWWGRSALDRNGVQYKEEDLYYYEDEDAIGFLRDAPHGLPAVYD